MLVHLVCIYTGVYVRVFVKGLFKQQKKKEKKGRAKYLLSIFYITLHFIYVLKHHKTSWWKFLRTFVLIIFLNYIPPKIQDSFKNASIAYMNLFINQKSFNQAHTQPGATRAMSEHQALTGRAATCSSYTHVYRYCKTSIQGFLWIPHGNCTKSLLGFYLIPLCSNLYLLKVYVKLNKWKILAG